jgi:uncharacterized protein (TIGR02996 family)
MPPKKPKKTPPPARDTERAAFMTAIVATPDDDTARLVFADWLDEHGESARAEFIRLGCQHARLDEDNPQWWPLKHRLDALEQKHSEEWEQDLPPWARKGVSFRRGFVSGIVTSATLWIKRSEKLLSAAPITSVRLQNVRELLPELMRTPTLARLRWLSLGWNNLAGRMRTVTTAPALANLRALELNLAHLTDDDAKALAGSRHLAGLVSLNLRRNGISEAGAIALAKTRHLLNLRKLEFTENRIGDRGLRALAGSPVLANVWQLSLHQNHIEDAGAIALASSPQIGSLRWLSIGGNAIGDAGATALANSPHLGSLKRLYLHRNTIGEAGALALAASPVLGALEDLTLDKERIGAKAAKALHKRFGKKVVRL